jgi:hypothetical protein
MVGKVSERLPWAVLSLLKLWDGAVEFLEALEGSFGVLSSLRRSCKASRSSRRNWSLEKPEKPLKKP